jgi:signal transduction histidine kinase
VGMTLEQIARAFDPLYSTKHRGTGLGLALVRRVIEAHDGRLTLESEPGQGTTARVWLPNGAAEEPAMLPALIRRPPDPTA